jgi:peroxiredoxin
LAQAVGFTEDWRLPYDGPAEMDARVNLDDLGPPLWSPPLAPDWEATDPQGLAWSTDDMRGGPRILILFLGLGCVHCVEQLQAFGPRTEDFKDLGVELVAIGDDTFETLAAAEVAEVYPFPILADPEYRAFHAYRSFDDFESAPLHGTFLIDADDRIRWMDVGAEPFTDMDFLLAETERLLSFDVEEFEVADSPDPASEGTGSGH